MATCDMLERRHCRRPECLEAASSQAHANCDSLCQRHNQCCQCENKISFFASRFCSLHKCSVQWCSQSKECKQHPRASSAVDVISIHLNDELEYVTRFYEILMDYSENHTLVDFKKCAKLFSRSRDTSRDVLKLMHRVGWIYIPRQIDFFERQKGWKISIIKLSSTDGNVYLSHNQHK